MTEDIVIQLRRVPDTILRFSGHEPNPYYYRCQTAADEIESLRSLLDQFISACEIDGFGHVHDVHFGDLTQAYKNSIEVLK